MNSVDDLTSGARTLLRDYPKYFEIDEGPLNVLTVRLPHPLISPSTLQVYLTTPESPGPPRCGDDADQRLVSSTGATGCSRSPTQTALGKRALVAGYHYSWFSDEELGLPRRQGRQRDDLRRSGTRQMSASSWTWSCSAVTVHALWSLAMELALDIDVSTPEGMFIPARQRYTQVLQMAGTRRASTRTRRRCSTWASARWNSTGCAGWPT